MINWYLQTGNESDVVLSSRIRVARNIDNIPFTNRYTKEDSKKVLEMTKNTIEKIGYGLKFVMLKDLDDVTIISLIEKHLISGEFAYNKKEIGAIAINDDENICIMINEEDHLRLQVMSAGLDLENTLNLLKEIDEKISKDLSYAFNEKYGFLTSCPTNVGTGLRASVMVHLPALTKTGNIRKILDVINGFDMNIRGLYGEGTEVKGDIYQISNKQSIGITEEDIIKNLKIITDKVIEQERLARKILGKNQIELEDKVYRAYGILTNCKKISSSECERLLSDVKLGVDMGIIDMINDLKVRKLLNYTKPGNMQKYAGEVLDANDRDIKRAEIIKQIINE